MGIDPFLTLQEPMVFYFIIIISKNAALKSSSPGFTHHADKRQSALKHYTVLVGFNLTKLMATPQSFPEIGT